MKFGILFSVMILLSLAAEKRLKLEDKVEDLENPQM